MFRKHSSSKSAAPGSNGGAEAVNAGVDLKSLQKALSDRTDTALTSLASLSESPEMREDLVPLLAEAINVAKTFALGTLQREALLTALRNVAKGKVEKDRYGELQVKAYALVSEYLVSELRDEAADSGCKKLAIEAIRNFGRNYALKTRVFETEGLIKVVFSTIRQQTLPDTHDLCLVLLTTLATDSGIADGFLAYYSQELTELLTRLLNSKLIVKWNETSDVEHGIHLAQNLSQHDSCRPILAGCSAVVNALAKLTNGSAVKKEDAVMQALMALANIIGDDESKTDLLQGSANGLIKLVHLLARVLDGKDVHFTLETVLRPLRRLCPPDRNRLAMSPTLTPILPLAIERALEIEDRTSAELAFGILSQLSFDTETLSTLRNDPRIATAFSKISQFSSTSDSANAAKWVKVARAADIARFNLHRKSEMIRRASSSRFFIQLDASEEADLEVKNQDESVRPALRRSTTQRMPIIGENNSQQIRLMISYQWKYQETAKLLALLLKQTPGISVWIDIQKMKAEVMESMADAVATSDYILILVSETYKNSSACKCEAMYAFELKKPMIPIVVEKDYVAVGWLGALIAGKLRYDCSDQVRVTEQAPRILNELLPGAAQSATDANKVSAISQNPVSSVHDVSQWLRRNGLDAFVDAFEREQVDGEVLRMLKEDYSAFAADLQVVFGMDFKTRVKFRKDLLNDL